MHNNTNVDNGIRVGSASKLVACLQACIDNTNCTGVDFDDRQSTAADQRCWMSGPWSGSRNSGATGIKYYEFRRDCAGCYLYVIYQLTKIYIVSQKHITFAVSPLL